MRYSNLRPSSRSVPAAPSLQSPSIGPRGKIQQLVRFDRLVPAVPANMGLWLPSSLSAALFAIALPPFYYPPVSYQLLVILASLARIGTSG
jgi:hypothetical protein